MWVKSIALQDKIKNLPHTFGCYLFYNEKKQLIYVGKAKNLHKRVQNYFNKVHNLKTTQLVRDITDLAFILTSNEKEALLLEHNLIKEHRPRYNILLSDDKTYPYIKITSERNPEYRYVRRISKDQGKYYGPFPDGSGAREVLKILQQLFPLRRCKGNLGHPCLYYHLQLCSGACFKQVPESYYLEMKRKINNFFHGKTTNIRKKIIIKMQQAASNLQYEEAGRIKKVLDKLQLFHDQQNVQFLDYRNRDFVGYVFKENLLAITTLFYRSGQLLSKDEQIFYLFNNDLTDAIRNYLQQLYSVNTLPQELFVLNINLDDLAAIFKIKIFSKVTPKIQEILNIATKNADELLKQHLLSNQQKIPRHFEIIDQLGKLLEIPSPNYIEIVDIANLGDEYIVGGVIVYQDGQAVTRQNRRYNIKTKEKGDYYYLKNLIYRRFWKKLMNKEPLPDLIIVDGGKLQISGVQSELQQLNISIPVVGLVKNKHHKTDYLLNMAGNIVEIPKKSNLFHWLIKVQEEVHNYTISFHRQKRSISLFASTLTTVKGLSTKKISELYLAFETLTKIKAASFAELNAIIKNKTTTQALIEHFQE